MSVKPRIPPAMAVHAVKLAIPPKIGSVPPAPPLPARWRTGPGASAPQRPPIRTATAPPSPARPITSRLSPAQRAQQRALEDFRQRRNAEHEAEMARIRVLNRKAAGVHPRTLTRRQKAALQQLTRAEDNVEDDT